MSPRDIEKLDAVLGVINDLRVQMAAMSGKLDGFLARMESHEARSEDHEQRLRRIERRLYAVPGVGVVIACAGFALAAYDRFVP